MLHPLLAIFLWLALPANCAPGVLRNRDAFSPRPPLHQRVSPATVITLRRTECFGTCPVYKLTIFADGKVLYEGIRHVKKKGKAGSRISRAKLDGLIEEFDNVYYFNLRDAYTPGTDACRQSVTDMPSAVTSLTRNGKSKTINHYHGCRGADVLELLTKLEDKIDETVNVNQWLK